MLVKVLILIARYSKQLEHLKTVINAMVFNWNIVALLVTIIVIIVIIVSAIVRIVVVIDSIQVT